LICEQSHCLSGFFEGAKITSLSPCTKGSVNILGQFFCGLPFCLTFALLKIKAMSKVIAGIFTIVGGLMTLYFLFILENSSYILKYNDPKLHKSLFETGDMPQLMIGILMLTVGLIFFFFAKEPNLK
jgi:hypothetical protein